MFYFLFQNFTHEMGDFRFQSLPMPTANNFLQCHKTVAGLKMRFTKVQSTNPNGNDFQACCVLLQPFSYFLACRVGLLRFAIRTAIGLMSSSFFLKTNIEILRILNYALCYLIFKLSLPCRSVVLFAWPQFPWFGFTTPKEAWNHFFCQLPQVYSSILQ